MVADREQLATPAAGRADEVTPPSGARLGYLDNVKVVLTVGVIVGHAAMTY